MTTAGVRSRGLERLIRGARASEAPERCDLCSEPVPAGHRHMLDTDNGAVMCACQACSLLFAQDSASQGHFRLIPGRRVRLDPVPTDGLGVPVGLAFFVRRSAGSRNLDARADPVADPVVAHYPSPAGATQWALDPDAWREVAEARPELDGLAVDVEAFLVNTVQGRRQQWIVPIDDCFRLVAIVRQEWTGLSGGSRVWPAIERFFAELTETR